MPTTSTGLPYPDLTADNNPPADFQALATAIDGAYAKTSANVAALPTTGNYPGRRVWLLDIKGWAVWTGTAWDYDVAPTTTGITYGSGFTTVAEGSKVAKTGGLVTLRVAGQKATINAADVILTVAAAFRPPTGEFYRIAGSFNGSPRFATVDSDGNVKADVATTGGMVGTVVYPAARP